MFLVMGTLEPHVNSDVIDEARCEHLLLLSIDQWVGAVEKGETVLILHHQSGLS